MIFSKRKQPEAINITDRILLKTIYDLYYEEFCSYNNKSKRSSKIYVPINCEEVAKNLKVDPDIVFGRLYHYLDKKFRHQDSDGTITHLFALKVGDDRHAVNFPLLSAVVADLEQSFVRFTIPLYLSIGAILISFIALIYK